MKKNKSHSVSTVIINGITEATPILLLLSFFLCLAYVGIMQKDYYFSLFQDINTEKSMFIGFLIAIGIGIARMSSLFGSVKLYSDNRIGPALFLISISLMITVFEHYEAHAMGDFYASNNPIAREGYVLLYKASVWFTLPLELAIAFIYRSVTDEEQEAETDQQDNNTPHHIPHNQDTQETPNGYPIPSTNGQAHPVGNL